MQEGKQEGRLETQQETAKVMLENGYALSEISKITGLSTEEINQLTH